MADREFQADFRSLCRAPALMLVAALAALLPLPAAALSAAPSEGAGPFIMPLRREAIPVYHSGKLVSFKTSYSGLVHIGWPQPQELRVVFDTGSGHIVVPSTRCQEKACLTKNRYDPFRSATGHQVNLDGSLSAMLMGDSVTIGFGRGRVQGTLRNELVCLGPAPDPGGRDPGEGNATSEDHCVTSGIVTAFNMSSDPFENFTFDGIVGLGLKSLAVAERFSFLHNLASQNGSRFSSGQFGVFLAEGDDEEESEIAFGGHNPAHLLEPLTWVPLAKPEFGYWLVDVLGVYVDGVRLDVCSEGPCPAILDTGTSHFGVPESHADALADLLRRPAGDLSDCRLVAAPVVTVELRGYNLTILPENYMRRLPLDSAILDDKDKANGTDSANGTAANTTAVANATELSCTAKLMNVQLPVLGPNTFLLGEPALHRYYTAYDAKALRAGFGLAARRKRAPEPEEAEVSHDEIFLMQQMRGIRPARKKTA